MSSIPDEQKLEKIITDAKLSPAEIRAMIDRIQHPDAKPSENRARHRWGTRHVKIGLGGDTHYGSHYIIQENLDDYAKRCKKEGIDAMYLTGDITEGYSRRKGHAFECNLHGADAQVKGVVDNMPDFGAPIYFITGDHDGWHKDNGGIDVGKQIDMQRPDMHYLGAFNATIDLAKNTSMMLVHPAKGTAYAISYQIQKLIESLSGGQKPNILGVGHYHKIEYLKYRNVHAFQTGCFQDQTPWMKRMNLSAHLGAWILDIWMKKDGSVDRLDMKLISYY